MLLISLGEPSHNAGNFPKGHLSNTIIEKLHARDVQTSQTFVHMIRDQIEVPNHDNRNGASLNLDLQICQESRKLP